MRTEKRWGCILVAMLAMAAICSCADYAGNVGGEPTKPATPAASVPATANAAADPNLLLGTWKGDWQWTAQSVTGSCPAVLVVERISGDTADCNYSGCGSSRTGKAEIFFRENMPGLAWEDSTAGRRRSFLLREDGKLQGGGTADIQGVPVRIYAIMEKSK